MEGWRPRAEALRFQTRLRSRARLLHHQKECLNPDALASRIARAERQHHLHHLAHFRRRRELGDDLLCALELFDEIVRDGLVESRKVFPDLTFTPEHCIAN